MSITVMSPSHGEKAYSVAAEIFCDMYEKITGARPTHGEDTVLIGSDAVNDTLAELMLDGTVGRLGIRYGTDDYCIRSQVIEGRRVLILAGGRGRSTIYAVYRFFELKAGCRYFWDGDIIPTAGTVDIGDIDITESPRFDYRGLRWFAHRGLVRFQAEHWGEDDWKRELDWMLKKRLNLFMLRIGNDDLFQRAFPDIVDYPDAERDPAYTEFHDRTPFWDLKFRGQLRERVMDYARERDLMSPSDCGTMTHWYSRTPQQYLDAVKPSVLGQTNKDYPDTIQVWDVRKPENMDAYMSLTDTEVRDFTKSGHLFHTIGLAERNMLESRDANLRLKLFTYRRIAQTLRERYPDSKLFVASWDFVGWWHHDEVKELLRELDPERTVILDYTSDGDDPDTTFINWGVVGSFPWVFGIFHAYEGENTLRGPYTRIKERLDIAARDTKCIGMILWPELSHSDPLMLEYLCHNAWSPDKTDAWQMVDKLCRDRYINDADAMRRAWMSALPVLELTYWNGYSVRSEDDPEYKKYVPYRETRRNLWHYPAYLPRVLANKHMMAHLEYKCGLYDGARADAVNTLRTLLPVLDSKDEKTRRDALDIARTVIDVYLNDIMARACFVKSKEAVHRFTVLMSCLCDILASSPDFSLLRTLEHINSVRPVADSFETTLKNNIENRYCRQQCYELVKHVIARECDIAMAWLSGARERDIASELKSVSEYFYNTPIADMQPAEAPDLKTAVEKAIEIIRE